MQPSYFPPPLRSSSLRTFSVVGVVASVLLLALSSVAADELPKPIPDDIGGVTSPAPPTEGPKIHIPVMPVLTEPEIIDELPAPPPQPSRGPVPVASLQEDTWYIIESAVPLIVLHSPSGFVECEENRGPRPMAVRGKFADGTGRTETRTFQSEYLYFVNAVKGGQIELMVIPVGVESEVDVIRQTLTVMGTAPQPPLGSHGAQAQESSPRFAWWDLTRVSLSSRKRSRRTGSTTGFVSLVESLGLTPNLRSWVPSWARRRSATSSSRSAF